MYVLFTSKLFLGDEIVRYEEKNCWQLIKFFDYIQYISKIHQ